MTAESSSEAHGPNKGASTPEQNRRILRLRKAHEFSEKLSGAYVKCAEKVDRVEDFYERHRTLGTVALSIAGGISTILANNFLYKRRRGKRLSEAMGILDKQFPKP